MRKALTIKAMLLVVVLAAMPFGADARITRFDLFVRFFFAISIEDVVSIDYGTISYNGNSAGTDIRIDPADGSITCTNSTDYNCLTSGVRGQFRVTGFPGQPIEISCEDNAVMAFSGQTLDIKNAQVRVGGITHSCAGLLNVSVGHILSFLSANNTFQMGATVEVPQTGLPALGAYSTSNPAGNPIRIRVRYQ